MRHRIVAVLGDFYHREDWLRRSLQEVVEVVNRSLEGRSEMYELSIIPYNQLTDALKKQPKLVVLSKEERLYPEEEDQGSWLHVEKQEAAVRYVQSGGAWLAWHSGLAYRTDGPYRRMLRGWFKHHPEAKPVRYEATNNSELQLTPEESFSIWDEHYFVHCEELKTNVFLRSISEDGQSIAGWAHTVGDGRVCCLTPAHFQEGLLDESFLQMLASCMKFCLREN